MTQPGDKLCTRQLDERCGSGIEMGRIISQFETRHELELRILFRLLIGGAPPGYEAYLTLE
jgi:hypothetical protein